MFMYSPFILSERAQDDQYCTCDVKICSPNSLKRSEVGAAVGMAILVMCLVIAVITVIVILCWWRWVREREVDDHKLILHSNFKLTCRKKLSGKGNVAISENSAYGDVNVMSEGGGEDDENPEMILRPPDGQSLADNNTTVDGIIYENISCASQPAAEMPENSDTNDTECATVSS